MSGKQTPSEVKKTRLSRGRGGEQAIRRNNYQGKKSKEGSWGFYSTQNFNAVKLKIDVCWVVSASQEKKPCGAKSSNGKREPQAAFRKKATGRNQKRRCVGKSGRVAESGYEETGGHKKKIDF